MSVAGGGAGVRSLSAGKLFLGGLCDVLDDLVQFFYELPFVVPNAVQVSAEAGYALSDPTGFFDLFVVQSI
jgi:hypothetical protein